MIDLKDAQAQLQRMMQLDFGPRGREQRQEVLRLMCQARTPAIATKAVTAWLDGLNPKFPKPGEIGYLISQANIAHDEAVASEARTIEWQEAARQNSGRRKEMWDMTAEELDNMPNFQTGLPTNSAPRKAALEAWRAGGPKALNDWRMQHWAETHAQNRPKPVAQIAEDAYRGEF